MNLKYEIIIWWSDWDDVFIAEVPELPGCNAYGPAYADAMREIQVAMSLWIDTVEEFGMKVPEPMAERLAFSYMWHADEKPTEARVSGKYSAIIYWSEEDAAFIAQVPELPGCVTDGQTYDEAIAELQIVMDLWVETAKEFDWEIPKPQTRPHFVDLTEPAEAGVAQSD